MLQSPPLKLYSPTGRPLSIRAKYDSELIYKPIRKKNHGGRIQNISTSGTYFLTNERLPVGSKLVLYIPLPLNHKKPICIVSGSVVRGEKPIRMNSYGYGIQFDQDISASSKWMLENFVEYKTTGKTIRKPVELKTKELFAKKRANQAYIATLPKINYRTQEKSNVSKAWLTLFTILCGLALGWTFHFIQTKRWYAQLTNIVPLSELEVRESSLHARTTEEWIQSNSDDSKKTLLLLLAKELKKKDLQGALILDPQGRTAAKIMRNSQNGEVVIQLH